MKATGSGLEVNPEKLKGGKRDNRKEHNKFNLKELYQERGDGVPTPMERMATRIGGTQLMVDVLTGRFEKIELEDLKKCRWRTEKKNQPRDE